MEYVQQRKESRVVGTSSRRWIITIIIIVMCGGGVEDAADNNFAKQRPRSRRRRHSLGRHVECGVVLSLPCPVPVSERDIAMNERFSAPSSSIVLVWRKQRSRVSLVFFFFFFYSRPIKPMLRGHPTMLLLLLGILARSVRSSNNNN